MSMPKIPDITPVINVDKCTASNMIITSIAMEELALAHILNAEGEKLQYILGTLYETELLEVTFCDIMAVNNSVQKTLRDVIKAELLLQLKLESVIEFAENGEECEMTISGLKIWDDDDNQNQKRPDKVTIYLMQNGAQYRTATILKPADKVSTVPFSFTCVPRYDASGVPYVYTVDEEAVADYQKEIEGFNITNYYNTPYVS